ncbi:alcohol dehydrogenase catalytic domain-containing protein [Brevibacillus marinus]|uniref:alcohol dehydrogenase catalytic domain-containing protein n=1 Tax=Brevibacillus marinus TaxID=2496837 RepID=UPI000F822969|nr:alcohol dehydrogenase catalytic domain-containing protein [Brevibacillus marinus]
MGAITKELPSSMKAIVAYGPHDYRLEERPTPKPGWGEVIVKVLACGVCASDIKAFKGAGMYWGDEFNQAWMKAPVTPGHEFFGEVVALGEGAAEKHGVQLGDWVIAEQLIPCETCRYCKRGEYWMCQVHNMFGFQKEVAEGGMAEYMRFPQNAIVHKIPRTLTLEQAAIIEPLACAIHAVQRAKIELDDTVVIAGAGPLGLFMVQVAHLKTPKNLVVLDMKDERLELSRKYGADTLINPAKEDAVEKVLQLTDGYGCDVYIETTGHPSGVTQGLKMIRKLGRFVEFSVFGQPTTADWSVIGDKKELDVLGSHISPYTYPIAINLLERGLVKVDDIVTHSFSLDEYQKAFEVAAKGDSSIKVLLKP